MEHWQNQNEEFVEDHFDMAQDLLRYDVFPYMPALVESDYEDSDYEDSDPDSGLDDDDTVPDLTEDDDTDDYLATTCLYSHFCVRTYLRIFS